MDRMLSLLVLSCDKYSDLWENFFKLRDRYWKDCDFNWYLVTETAEFHYPGVEVIHTGKNRDWTGRLKYAVQYVNTKYIGWYLDDFFICSKVDNNLIHALIEKMDKCGISHINMSDVFYSLVKMPEEHKYYDEHLLIIPKHKKYGISTASAIWDSSYLLDILGEEDKNAWQFELDLCNIAQSEEGLQGIILCDDRMPFNVTKIPVVIQGKYYPKAIKYFNSLGYKINTKDRGFMSLKDVIIFDCNDGIRNILRDYPRLSKVIKWVAKNIFRIKFFT